MGQTESAALITAIIAAVLGGLGLIGGLVGYVQGAAALKRASLARQRAATAEEAARLAQLQAEQAARSAERALDRIERGRLAESWSAVATGPVVQAVPVVPPQPEPVPPVVVAAADPPREVEVPEPTPADAEPAEAVREAEPEPAEPAEESAPPEDAAPAPEDAAPAPEDAAPAPEPAATRAATGQVTAGAPAPLTMDWKEALRTGAIPLPSKSRGTYAAPARKRRSDAEPTGEGPARFALRTTGRQRFEVVNVGGETAVRAAVDGIGEESSLVRPVSPRPRDVEAGGTLAFSVLRVEGREVAAVRVVWRADGVERSEELPLG